MTLGRMCFFSLGLMSSAITRSTSRPSKSSSMNLTSKYCSTRFGSNSTRRSMSLSSRASFRANDPNRPSRRTPRARSASRWLTTERKMSSRLNMTDGGISPDPFRVQRHRAHLVLGETADQERALVDEQVAVARVDVGEHHGFGDAAFVLERQEAHPFAARGARAA